MKSISLLGLFFVTNVCLSSPVDYRWNLIADGDGRMHSVDLQPLEVAPEPLFNAETDTEFLLFTRSNRLQPQRITWNAASISASNFNAAHPVRVLIHGFNSGPSSGANIAPTAAYLENGDFNVIVVDWSRGAGTINYVGARNRVDAVGETLARLLNFLVANGSTSWDRVIIAGHSLGAHIAGICGKRTAGRVQVIFGLDPAGPLFSLNSPEARFAADDAVYTEGIRTNTGLLGFTEPLAHADFYPNWGTSQPGCGLDVSGSCAHSRAHQFFAESINSNRFVGRRCNSFQEITSRNCPGVGSASMGGNLGNVGLRGIFFVETNGNSPFARG